MINLFSIYQTIPLFDSFVHPFQKIVFTYSDILDFLVINLLIFSILILLKKTRSMPVIFGVALLGIIYGMSSLLNLHITHTVFSTFFGMFLIFIAIIFQEEIKRLFELIGFIGLRKKINTPKPSVVDILIESVKSLSDKKIGALIVFAGKENLNRQLEGGISINGEISFPLLLSIFSSATPGHDGAIIVEGNKISRFAVHLPLSENKDIIKKYGTRHRAATGLSERTDALIIVVSEETGEISVAQNKRINKIKRIENLRQVLQAFIKRKFPKKSHYFYKNWLKNNIKLLISSVILTFVFWLFFSYQASIVQQKFTVPIQFEGVSNASVVENYIPEDAVVVFSGRKNELKLLKPNSLKISIDLTSVDTGWHQIAIRKEDVDHPSNISVINIDPGSVRVNVEKEDKVKESLENK